MAFDWVRADLQKFKFVIDNKFYETGPNTLPILITYFEIHKSDSDYITIHMIYIISCDINNYVIEI